MLRYRTEVVVPADRFVYLQLPPHFPEGRATVTVHFAEPSDLQPPAPDTAPDLDRVDIEWWEEFEGDPGHAG